ncbi:hypothetical protein ABFS83_09G093000 [Erythranthe nasuta]
MGSLDQQSNKLPTIEFNQENMTPGTNPWKSTSDSVRQALEMYGCFVVSYESNIGTELHKKIFDGGLSEELFGLPLETKKKHTSKFAGFGYGGNYSVMPLFEYFGIEDVATLDAAQKFTTLMWSQGHDKFCETIYSYCKLLSELNKTVVKMVADSYGLEKYYDPLMESSFYMTRLMRYNTPGENQCSIGIVPHRDKSFITVIGTNEVKGLEIETRGGDWIDYEPSLGKFIVIAGEPFMAWSNGRIYSPLHKVVAKGSKEKHSVGVFSFIGGVLEVPKELVDHKNPLKFKSFRHLEFVEYCKEGGAKMEGAIQKYCGI